MDDEGAAGAHHGEGGGCQGLIHRRWGHTPQVFSCVVDPDPESDPK